ncbi:fluoride efflux transporter CrcB [Brevundimonas bacteroides]|uniref:fluoride efflux transporter CrcB n=1 Tax=Brevundimonas bacteroides TaxID=74311 RepID=UPI000495EC67|nr:fluoride efflux transporter CrcB [Brevundimonas bacteroides]
MERLLIVGLGGALGSMARYGAGLAAARLAPGAAWPWATLSVNAIGGLLMGLLVGWLAQRGQGSEAYRLFAAVGVLGGFTTFSAFSLETVQMIERRQFGLAAAYVALSVILACAALFLGLMIARRVFGAAL